MLDTAMEPKNETEAGLPSAAPENRWQPNAGSDFCAPRAWLAEGWAYATLPKTAEARELGTHTVGASAAAPTKVSHWRTPGPPEALLIPTRNWLAQMPETLRPQELVRLFPRIANNLGGLWEQPKVCATYLSSLLSDTRDGTRKGFPKRVAEELAVLRGEMEAQASAAGAGRKRSTEQSFDLLQ